ncbi:unnamed protein product [Urochloa humidicola]
MAMAQSLVPWLPNRNPNPLEIEPLPAIPQSTIDRRRGAMPILTRFALHLVGGGGGVSLRAAAPTPPHPSSPTSRSMASTPPTDIAVQVCRMSADTNARAGSVERRRRVPVPPPGPAAGPGLPGTRGAGPPPLPRGAHDMTLANILAAGGSGTKEGDVLAATYSKYGDNGSSVC